MSADQEILRFIHGSGGRFVTARATVREWRDEKTAGEVRGRFSATEAYRRSFGPPRSRAAEPSQHERGNFERIWRVWHEKPDRWRQEIELSGGSGTEYRVVDGKATWIYSPEIGARAATTEGKFGPEFEIAYLFDPYGGAPVLDDLEMRVVGRIRQAGREAVRVEATMLGEWKYPPDPLMWGADDYELVVDAERGVILRSASRLGGQAFDIMEILDVGFDEVFPDGTFVLDLPGVEFGRVDRLT